MNGKRLMAVLEKKAKESKKAPASTTLTPSPKQEKKYSFAELQWAIDLVMEAHLESLKPKLTTTDRIIQQRLGLI
ncbi:hypothetical protein [Stutzerimonas decontaminans]|uniref:Uncharacterized protein n=1 Tax=Stutzerimonas stutzeri TaxID=316 RepID=A0A023WYE8_STUST|nr:hypothetical protein [Stutzerimonas decontaminans]AHY45078.1 hypothetical protein UIB01_07080 [Stutzerimonas decontaminans]